MITPKKKNNKKKQDFGGTHTLILTIKYTIKMNPEFFLQDLVK